MTMKSSFAPVINAQIRLLVLGSLPGERSLAQQQYYAHPQNRFWLLMSEVIDRDLSELSYPARLQALLNKRVGLWDVVAKATRHGSLDSRIRNIEHNDLIELIETLPKLEALAFNGGTAARIGLKMLKAYPARPYQMITLPSSSPAYTLSYGEKRRAWGELKKYVTE